MRFQNIFTKKEDIENIRRAGRISDSILVQLRDFVAVGKTPQEIDELAGELCEKAGVKPSFKGVPGPQKPFPANSCVLVNDEIVHAIPNNNPIKNGDIVKIDFGIIYKGFYTDHCVTVGVGDITEDEQHFINTARLSIDVAVKQAVVGNRIGDISNALQTVTELAGFESTRGFGGHGIGKWIHMEPHISFQGFAGTGYKLEEGMILCIENWMAMKSAKVKMEKDGWTIRTVDGSKSACFEHMVLVGKNEAEVLTKL